ncbi:MAG: hypothetical protein ACJA2E_001944, partial [Arenicella sp.]
EYLVGVSKRLYALMLGSNVEFPMTHKTLHYG